MSLFLISLFRVCLGLLISNFERTYPVDREQLTQSPSTIEFGFEEPVVLHGESITLVDSAGNTIKLEQAKFEPNDKTHIITSVPQTLTAGKYKVKINVIALDGFVIQEKLGFEVVKEEVESSSAKLKIEKYSPDDGEITTGSPQKIHLWFNRPSEITAIGLFDDHQKSVRLKEPYVNPKDPNHIIVEIDEEILKGTYQVTWYDRPIGVDINQPDILDVFYFAVDEFTPIQQTRVSRIRPSGLKARDFSR